MIAVVLLAAGLSRRMGRDKLMLPVQGRPLYAFALDLMQSLRADMRLVVTNNPRIAAEAAQRGLDVIANPAAASGMGTSVAAGTNALHACVQTAVFLNADQPFLKPETINRLTHAAEESGKIIVPHVHGAPCSPCVFPRRFFGALSALSGEQGGKAVWSAHPDAVLPFMLHADDDFRDIDTPEDYREINRNAQE